MVHSRFAAGVAALLAGSFLAGCGNAPPRSTVLAAGAAGIRTPRDFGASGNGQTDDTAALQRAADVGGGIFLTRGVYRITKPVVIDLDRSGPVSITGDGTGRLVMAGPGPALKLAGTHRASADPGTFKENVWQRQRMPLLDGFEILGAHPDAIGIQVDGVMQATFTRLLIRRVRHGIHLTGRNRNVIISDCHIYDNRGVGVLFDKLNLHQTNITGSHISYNAGGGIVVRDSEIRNLHVAACDIESNMAPDGAPTANILLDSRNGSIREGAITGCTLQHNHESRDSANIRMIGRNAENERQVGAFSIGDNHISDVNVGIHLKYARGVAITGNTFLVNQRYHLVVEGSSNIAVGPNVFDRNPDYGTASADRIVFEDSTDCSINGLHINQTTSGEPALVLRRCRRFNVTNAAILNAGPPGILLDDVRDSRVSDCLIRDDRPGGPRGPALRLTAGTGNMIVNNLLGGNADVASGSAHVEGNR